VYRFKSISCQLNQTTFFTGTSGFMVELPLYFKTGGRQESQAGRNVHFACEKVTRRSIDRVLRRREKQNGAEHFFRAVFL
jgi:hypothetical protein